MNFPLAAVAGAVDARAPTWAGLGFEWHIRPVHPNHGKAVVAAQGESPAWLLQFTIWATGETELDAIRPADERIIVKHYDLTGLGDLEAMLDELVALMTCDRIPAGAIVVS